MSDTINQLRERVKGLGDDPFVTGLFGGSPRMATFASGTSIDGTTVRESQSERETLSSGRATRSSSDRPKGTPPSRGGSVATDATGKKASSVAYSATRAPRSRRSLSDRLTPSLISSGLVRGITPSSTRKQSGQPIQVLAFDTPDGAAVARPRRVFSSSNATLKETDHV